MLTLDILLAGDVVDIRAEVQPVDLRVISKKILDAQYKQYFLANAGREHYKLLASVASVFEGSTVYDIGTHFGLSSLAMSYNPNVKVVSYDVEEMKKLSDLPENVEYRIGDFRQDADVLNSPFIFVDVDPHDGIQEADFHKFFLEKNYRGLVLWDDIHLNDQMRAFWRSIENTKYDITGTGHWSGTGMVIYG